MRSRSLASPIRSALIVVVEMAVVVVMTLGAVLAVEVVNGAAPVSAASRASVPAPAGDARPAMACTTGRSSACSIRLTFAPGAYSAQARSSLSGATSSRWFVVNLRAHQHLVVWVVGHGATGGTLYFPGGGHVGQPGGRVFDDEVPRSGDYRIRVSELVMGDAWSGRVDVLVVAL